MQSLKLLLIVVSVALLSVVESRPGWHKNKGHWSKHKGDHHHQHGIDGQKEEGNNSNNNNSNNNNNNSNGGSPFRQEVSDDPDQAFKDFAKQVTAFDQLSSKYCEKNKHDGVSEIYGTKNYKLLVPLKNLDTDLIEIKIRHRVIYIKGAVPEIDPRWQSDDDAHFNDIRRLPDILDVKKATWVLRNERIEVTIPYKFALDTEIKMACVSAVNDDEFIVPEDKAIGDIDQSVIDEIFGGGKSK